MKTRFFAMCAAVAWLAMDARAGETPYGSQGPSAYYYFCFATASGNGMPTYATPVFADTAKAGQQALSTAFRKFLAQKYGASGQNGACMPNGSAAAAEASKKDRLQFAKNVVDTGWTPSG